MSIINWFLFLSAVLLVFLSIGYIENKNLEFHDQQREWESRNLPYYTVSNDNNEFPQFGIASWYDYKMEPEIDEDGFFTGREIGVPCPPYDTDWKLGRCITQEKAFAASRKFKKGDILMVLNEETGAFVNVIVTDYIEHPDRIIDLSSFAFSKIAPLEVGLIDVRVEKIGNINKIEQTK